MRLIALLLVLIQTSAALRVLLTSTDSWVSKNVRFMYESLKEEGHDVRVVAPLYRRKRPSGAPRSGNNDPKKHRKNSHIEDATDDEEHSNPVAPASSEIPDGGEFGHLLPVHQTYYSNMRHINKSPRGAKGVIKKNTSDNQRRSIVTNNHFGQDPLDDNIWYVNAGALDTLVIAMDVIAPQMGFEPELVLVGPNEGASYTPQGSGAGGPRGHRGRGALHAMLNYCMSKNVPSIGVSTEDSHHVYYHDEKYFNIEPSAHQSFFKTNVFGTNIQYINKKVLDVLSKVEIAKDAALNIIFPSINHDDSRCFTASGSTAPYFKQVEQELKPLEDTQFPKYEYADNKLTKVQSYKHASGHQQDFQYNPDSKAAGHKSRHTNEFEKIILESCGISINAMSLELGTGIPRSVLDIEAMVQSA